MVSQLKAIKQAGYHPEANVIAQFDPQTEGTPTHIFDVNLIEKIENPGVPNIGYASNDPFVRKLMDDKLWRDQKDRGGRFIRDCIRETLVGGGVYAPPEPPPDRNGTEPGTVGTPPELGPEKSLRKFLEFCAANYPAQHYALFILGHGLVVGNDVFLFDEHGDETSLSLRGLGRVLADFRREVDRQGNGAAFELIGFHSCSVSSLEVAYELQGTAKYMLASQGPAFVGTWPYRQILIRVFNDLEALARDGGELNIKSLLGQIFSYCMHNSADYLLAGYSFDLCLCNLNEVGRVKKPLEELSDTLVFGLAKPLIRDFILLAHWKAQSFWQESYTDLFDFCLCLSNHCDEYGKTNGGMTETMESLYRACIDVMKVLVKEPPPPPKGESGRSEEGTSAEDNFVVRAEFVGPAYQYSHGQSVYFPWAAPTPDSTIMEDYKNYRFEETSWRTFLEKYFAETLRETRKNERDNESPAMTALQGAARQPSAKDDLLEDMASLAYNREGRSSLENTLSNPPPPPRGKTNPRDLTGDDCVCSPIKNYPRDTRARRERAKQADEKSAPISDTFSAYE